MFQASVKELSDLMPEQLLVDTSEGLLFDLLAVMAAYPYGVAVCGVYPHFMPPTLSEKKASRFP